MPDIEPHLADDGVTRVSPPDPRTALFWDGTHWHVPRVDDHGRVQVRGEDQVFSIKGVLAETETADLTEASGGILSDVVPDGEYWVITNITALDLDNATTGHVYYARHNNFNYEFERLYEALAANRPSSYHGHVYLDSKDTIQVTFVGGLIGDTCKIILTGHIMTLET